MTVEQEAAVINACLDEMLDALAENVNLFRQDHTAEETLVGVRQDFIAQAYLDLASSRGSAVVANYASWGASLARLLEQRSQIAELTEQLDMHKSVIISLGELEDL